MQRVDVRAKGERIGRRSSKEVIVVVNTVVRYAGIAIEGGTKRRLYVSRRARPSEATAG